MNVEEVEHADYVSATKGLPVQPWNHPAVTRWYGTTRYFLAHDATATSAAWVCPVHSSGSIAREVRVMPYASPWLADTLSPSKRDRIVTALAEAAKRNTMSIDLPMSPSFSDTPGFLFAGYEVALRHTRILDLADVATVEAGYLPQVRAHIRAAGRRTEVMESRVVDFDFANAIVQQSTGALDRRRGAAASMEELGIARAWKAVDPDGVEVGGVLLARERDTVIAMHTWSDRRVRGTASLLIHTALLAATAEWSARRLDFEGSVLPGVDAFMAGFGAPARPYAQVRWSRHVTVPPPWSVA